MQRMTQHQLEMVVDRINIITWSPSAPYTSKDGGGVVANTGCFYLAGANGGWRLERIAHGGGSYDALTCGYVSMHELYNMMIPFIRGLEIPMTGGQQ